MGDRNGEKEYPKDKEMERGSCKYIKQERTQLDSSKQVNPEKEIIGEKEWPLNLQQKRLRISTVCTKFFNKHTKSSCRTFLLLKKKVMNTDKYLSSDS